MKVLLATPFLGGLPGQQAYADALRRHLPDPPLVASLRAPPHGTGSLGRTLAAWSSYPRLAAAAADADVVHGTDTFCAVRGADVLTVHDLIPLLVSREPAARLHHAAFARRLRAVPRVIVPTRTWARKAVAGLGLDPRRVRVIPQGCDPPGPAAPEPPHGFSAAADHHVLVVGSYRPYKRVLDLVEACALLPGVRLLRVGPVDESRYAQRCRRAARRLGADLADVGPVPEAAMASYYAHADLLAYVSSAEGFGLPPVEAMAAGTTPLLSDLDVFRELHGALPHYVRPGEDLAAALLRALGRPRPAAELRRHAARFTWRATAERTAGVYREVHEGADADPALLLREAEDPAPRAADAATAAKAGRRAAPARRPAPPRPLD